MDTAVAARPLTSEEEKHIALARQQFGETVVLRHVFGKQVGAITLPPMKSAITGKLKGVIELSPEEQRHSKRVVTETTLRTIDDGTIFNLNNPVDAIDWMWLKECEEIALSEHDSQMTPNCYFFVENVKQATSNRVDFRAKRANAMQRVVALSQVNLHQLARILGTPTNDWEHADVLDFVSEIADTTPDKIINALDDENFKLRLLICQMQDKNIIIKKDGIWFYENHLLGKSDNEILAWIKDPNNQDVVQYIYLDINPLPASPAERRIRSSFDPIAKLEQQRAEREEENRKMDEEEAVRRLTEENNRRREALGNPVTPPVTTPPLSEASQFAQAPIFSFDNQGQGTTPDANPYEAPADGGKDNTEKTKPGKGK